MLIAHAFQSAFASKRGLAIRRLMNNSKFAQFSTAKLPSTLRAEYDVARRQQKGRWELSAPFCTLAG